MKDLIDLLIEVHYYEMRFLFISNASEIGCVFNLISYNMFW